MLHLLTHPVVEPVHLIEAKRHLVVEDDEHDALIAGLITAARRHVEERARYAMVMQTWELTLDHFPGCVSEWLPRTQIDYAILLARGPLSSVVSLSSLDPAGVPQTLSNSDYTVDVYSAPARILPAYGKVWPRTRAQLNAVAVRYRVGEATPFTVNATSDTLTALGRPLTNDEIVRLSNSGGTLPGGLNAQTDYSIVQASGSTGKLALTSGGAALDIADMGSGTHFLGVIPQDLKHALLFLLAHWYENREPVNIGNTSPLPMTVEALIGPYRQIEVV